MSASNPAPNRRQLSEAEEIDRIYRATRRFFAFKIGQRDAVEELTHEVVLIYISKRREGLTVLDPAKFARGIARNVLLSHLRARTRGKVPFDSTRMSPSKVYDSPATKLDRRQRVIAAMRALPNDLQDAMILRHVHALTLPECAAELKVSLATVKRHLRKAGDVLRRELGSMGGESPDLAVRHVWESV